MHELGLVNYVVKQVTRIAEENKVTKIHSVTLEFGEVEPVQSDLVSGYHLADTGLPQCAGLGEERASHPEVVHQVHDQIRTLLRRCESGRITVSTIQ